MNTKHILIFLSFSLEFLNQAYQHNFLSFLSDSFSNHSTCLKTPLCLSLSLVAHLEEPSLRREGVHPSVIFTSGQEHLQNTHQC